ncbi:hypothetical protein MRB53_034407 [Persea americana]|uniref:Uncharacterized protein n=1 Tax=Persea americana TaxID=3435 RepID=A0ACC2K1K0_PERAE|nr:hypothetical protein MRB53_034407 [Persea americana]
MALWLLAAGFEDPCYVVPCFVLCWCPLCAAGLCSELLFVVLLGEVDFLSSPYRSRTHWARLISPTDISPST